MSRLQVGVAERRSLEQDRNDRSAFDQVENLEEKNFRNPALVEHSVNRCGRAWSGWERSEKSWKSISSDAPGSNCRSLVGLSPALDRSARARRLVYYVQGWMERRTGERSSSGEFTRTRTHVQIAGEGGWWGDEDERRWTLKSVAVWDGVGMMLVVRLT